MQDASSKEQLDAKIQALEAHTSVEIVAKVEVEVTNNKARKPCVGLWRLVQWRICHILILLYGRR